MISGGLDANRWLETTLAHPSGRAALLDPDARVLAVGALVSEEPPLAGAVAVTYQLFGEENFPADAELPPFDFPGFLGVVDTTLELLGT